MDIQYILSKIDHTMLNPTSTWSDIRTLCDDAIRYNVASVCVPPTFVKKVKKYVEDKIAITTVIGFPNGYNTTAVKVYESKQAIKNGADEIDMVINLGDVKARKFTAILSEIKKVRKATEGKILKVIVEASELTKSEKIKMCEVVTASGADYIKTSTGYASGGATMADIKLFKTYIGENVSIKASGGIKSIEEAETYIELGSERLGTSNIIKILKKQEILNNINGVENKY